MRRSAIRTLLIGAHLVVLCGLFTWRYAPLPAREHAAAFERGEPSGNLLRLYMSREVEYYWFEWSWLVLGRELPADYPTARRTQFELGERLLEPARLRVPYRDIPFEYPPLLIAPLLLAAAFSVGPLSFLFVLATLCASAYLFALRCAYRIGLHLPVDRRPNVERLLVLSLLALLCLGQIAVTRLDVFLGAMMAAMLAAHLDGRTLRAASWLAGGILAKLVPVVSAPLLLADLLRARQRRSALLATACALGITAAGLALATLLAGADAARPLAQHTARPLQLESTWATVLLLLHHAIGLPVQTFVAQNAWAIQSSALSFGALPVIAPALACAAIVALYLRGPRSPERLVLATVLVFLALMLSFSVFSPQFLLWILPLALIVVPRGAATALLLAALVLTQLLWPNFYYLLEQAHPVGTLLLVARNGVLIALAVALALRLRGATSAAPAESAWG